MDSTSRFVRYITIPYHVSTATNKHKHQTDNNYSTTNTAMVRLFGVRSKQKRSPPNNPRALSDLPHLDEELNPPQALAPPQEDPQRLDRRERERQRRKLLRTRRRLVATARSPELLRDRHPMYQYALNEYAQTVQAGTTNDDGRALQGGAQPSFSTEPPSPASSIPAAPSSLSSASQRLPNPPSLSSSPGEPSSTQNLDQPVSYDHPSSSSSQSNGNSLRQGQDLITESTKAAAQSIVATAPNSPVNNPLRSRFEDEMPTPGYQEYYGDAYTGAPMKYIYPAGYQSMRPRSWPWRLSMIITVLFTWLSIFIVGHCSDQADADVYYNAEINDDTLMIDVRWCGSRPLYLMWVASMLINGLAAAYCGVIGYVKCRDFAVANTRAQPVSVMWSSPSLRAGMEQPPAVSDYYVRMGYGSDVETASSASGAGSYRPSIYQADGEPQFWGQQIYRPTQAAVAVTSR